MMQIAALVAHTYGVENIKVYREGLTVTLAVTADVSLADCLTITRQVEDILADREPIQ
jgi:ribosome maturation factor RimP